MTRHTQSFDRPCAGFSPATAFVLVLLTLVPTLFLLAPAEADAQLRITDVTPDEIASGETVTIEGTGFGAAPDAHRVWLAAPRGGALLDPTALRGGRLEAVAGPVESTTSGRLTVWLGAERTIPSHTMPLETRRGVNRKASLRCGRVFVPTARATGATVSIEPGVEQVATPRVVMAKAADDHLVIDLSTLQQVEPQASCCGGGGNNLCIGAVIETKGDGGSATDGGDGSGTTDGGESGESGEEGEETGGGDGDGTTTGGEATGGAFTIDLAIDLGPTTPRRPAKLASIVADALDQQFGSLGLTATARGARVAVTVPGGVHAGTLSLEY